MPCTPSFKSALQVVTAAVTAFPHTVGWGLPVAAVAVTAPAPATASVATVIPIAVLDATMAGSPDRRDIGASALLCYSRSWRLLQAHRIAAPDLSQQQPRSGQE